MRIIGAALTCVLATTLAAPVSALPDSKGARVTPLPTTADPKAPPPPPPVLPLGPPTDQPRYLLTAAESAIAFAGATIWYYHDPSLSVKDIDFNFSNSWKNRFITGEAIRFDDNAFSVNTYLHPSSGVVLYLIARGNRLGPVASFLVVTVASTIWEFVAEYREVASINDLIVTPMAGATFGEPLIRTSALLRAGGTAAGPVNSTVAAILDPIGALNDFIWTEPGPPEVPTDQYGLPLVYRHNLDFAAGAMLARFEGGRDRGEGQFAGDIFIDGTSALPGPGRRATTVGPGGLNYLDFEASFAGTQVSGARVASQVAVVGRQWQSAQGLDEVAIRRADDLFLGVATGFEFALRSRPGMPDDPFGIVRLVGPLFDWGVEVGELRLHLAASLSYDFAEVASLARVDYIAMFGTDTVPRVLWQHGYYYGQGLSASLRVRLQYRLFEAGGDAGEDDFWIIKGRDRFIPPLPEPNAFDRRAMRRIWMAAHFSPRLPFKVTIAADQIVRQGSLGPEESRLTELRTSAMLGFGF
jgi:hypothetical protein